MVSSLLTLAPASRVVRDPWREELPRASAERPREARVQELERAEVQRRLALAGGHEEPRGIPRPVVLFVLPSASPVCKGAQYLVSHKS